MLTTYHQTSGSLGRLFEFSRPMSYVEKPFAIDDLVAKLQPRMAG